MVEAGPLIGFLWRARWAGHHRVVWGGVIFWLAFSSQGLVSVCLAYSSTMLENCLGYFSILPFCPQVGSTPIVDSVRWTAEEILWLGRFSLVGNQYLYCLMMRKRMRHFTLHVIRFFPSSQYKSGHLLTLIVGSYLQSLHTCRLDFRHWLKPLWGKMFNEEIGTSLPWCLSSAPWARSKMQK